MNSSRDIERLESAPIEEGYRSQAIRDLGYFCKEFSITKCARCGRPLCAVHRHNVDTRCTSCEEEYKKALDAVRYRSGRIKRWFKQSYLKCFLYVTLGPMLILALLGLVTNSHPCDYYEQGIFDRIWLFARYVFYILASAFIIITYLYGLISLFMLSEMKIRRSFLQTKKSNDGVLK